MTTRTPSSPPATGHTLAVMAAAAALTVGSYVSWLGWSDGTNAEQVLGLAATLSVMVAIVTYWLADLGRAAIAVGVVAGTLAVTFWIDFASELTPAEAVWAVAAATFVAIGTAFGLVTVALLTWSLRRADWTPVVSAVLTVASYLGWLGWDQQRNPGGTGPYEAWQVVGLALTLAVVAAVSSWRSADTAQAMVVVLLMAAVLTVAFSIDAATDITPDANLWPVGALLLFGGATLGLWVVALLTRAGWQVTHPT
jgi:hypothetical protein